MTLVKPSTITNSPIGSPYIYKGQVSSPSQNYIDREFPNLLDKTGDNSTTSPSGGITGRIDVLSGGSILGQLGSQIGVELGGLLFVNGGEFNIVNNGQVNFGGDGSAPSLNMLGSTSQTFSAGTSLNIEACPTIGIGNAGIISFGSNSIASGLPFNSGVNVLITQTGAATTRPGRVFTILAQTGTGIGTGGTLLLQGGNAGNVSTAAAGAVTVVGGTGNTTGGTVNIMGGAGTGAIPNGLVNMQNGLIFDPWNTTNNSGGTQPQIIQNDMVVMTSTGSGSKPSFTIGSLSANQSAAVFVNYALRDASNAANSGAGSINFAFYHTGSGGANAVPFSAGTAAYGLTNNAANSDLNIGVVGNSFYVYVNASGSYTDTYNWTLSIKTIFN